MRLTGRYMPEDFSSTNLRGAVFAGRNLKGANFACANLAGADFSNADIEGADFSNANLSNAVFHGARVAGAVFQGANLHDTKFDAPRPSTNPTDGDQQDNGDGQNPDPREVILVEKCEDFATIQDGEFTYENNVWNRAAAINHGDTYHQCIRERELAGKREHGWIWAWPDRYEKDVYAYPEVIFGKKPWSRGDSTTTKLPVAIAELNGLTLDYEVETLVESGRYNLAPEIWITSVGGQPDESTVSAELMFWMDYHETTPAGEVAGEYTIDGRRFEVFFKPDMGSTSTWRYVAFRALERDASRATLRIELFLRFAIEHDYVDRNHFVSSVELGNEISCGRGQSWVKRLSVTVS